MGNELDRAVTPGLVVIYESLGSGDMVEVTVGVDATSQRGIGPGAQVLHCARGENLVGRVEGHEALAAVEGDDVGERFDQPDPRADLDEGLGGRIAQASDLRWRLDQPIDPG